MIRLNDIKVSLDYTEDEIRLAIAKKLKLMTNKIGEIHVIRRSVDARYDKVRFSLGIDVKINGEDKENVKLNNFEIPAVAKKMDTQPVVVGAGPAGMFASLILAKAGLKPILIERGQSIEKRKEEVNKFKNGEPLNAESNICFGEGGAGTFSDGKLVTRLNDARCTFVLEEFVKFGASKDILIDARPHIGTDILADILVKIRKEIIALGGSVLFEEKLVSIEEKNSAISAIKTNKRRIETNNLILAAGHGARDIYRMLNDAGVHLEAKGFAMGVRIEHPREIIDKAVYGSYAGHERLGAASYNLKAKFNYTNVFSFCMCPGGEVVNASTENDELCINGMSYHSRDEENSNAAIVCQINPNMWGEMPMEGLVFQKNFEKLAFNLGGGKHIAPAQRVADFMEGKKTKVFDEVKPSIKPGVSMAMLNEVLGEEISQNIKLAINYWEKRLKGYSMGGAVLTAIESRTSSPIRIVRDETNQSKSLKGLYPCGEGAGYAGGIMSAAVDGIRCASAIIFAHNEE